MSVRATVPPAAPIDDDDHARGGLIVEHYRVDASRQLARALGLGAAILTLGCLAISWALFLPRLGGPSSDDRPARTFTAPRAALYYGSEVTRDGVPIHRDVPAQELALGLFGLGCVVAGALTTLVSLNVTLREERYLALRTDGAFFRAGKERALIRWDEVEAVRFDATRREIRFERHDGSAWLRRERFAGIDGPTLAKRSADVRRRALFGLLG